VTEPLLAQFTDWLPRLLVAGVGCAALAIALAIMAQFVSEARRHHVLWTGFTLGTAASGFGLAAIAIVLDASRTGMGP